MSSQQKSSHWFELWSVWMSYRMNPLSILKSIVMVTSTFTSMVDQKQVQALITSPLKVTTNPGLEGCHATSIPLSSLKEVDPFRPFVKSSLSDSSSPSTVSQSAQSSAPPPVKSVSGPLEKNPSQATRLSEAATEVSSSRNSTSDPSPDAAPACAGDPATPSPAVRATRSRASVWVGRRVFRIASS